MFVSLQFGGRLVCFEHNPPTDPQQAQFVKRPVTVSQVKCKSSWCMQCTEMVGGVSLIKNECW